MPEISVVMPVRNGAGTVPRAIASIQAQTCADWELIAVDDGSTDHTAAVLDAAREADPRVRVLKSGEDGIVAALNAGIATARGAFIARMDADDESFPERLEAQSSFLRGPANASIGLVSCLVEFGGDRVRSEGYARHVDWINARVDPQAIALNRFVEAPFAHPSVMFRRELIAAHGGYRAGNFPEDYELWLRWLDAGVRMAKVPRVLLRWNDSRDRLSRCDPRYDPEAFFRVKARWITRELEKLGRSDVLIWGAGRPTRKRADLLREYGVWIKGYVDIDPKKQTRALGGTGVPVIDPRELPEPGKCFVLAYVSSRGASELIRRELLSRDYIEGRDFLMCA